MTYLNLVEKELNELKSALHAEEAVLQENEFPVEEFETYTVGDILVKMRNHYETAPNVKRTLAMQEKVKIDVLLKSIEHLEAQSEELNSADAHKTLLENIAAAKEYFEEHTRRPEYAHYADGETVGHMPKFIYLDATQTQYFNVYLAYQDYARALEAEGSSLELIPEFISVDTVSEAMFKSLIDGKSVVFNPQGDLEFLENLEAKLN